MPTPTPDTSNPAAALTDDTLGSIGHDSTSTFETRGNYAGSNPTENASSENLTAKTADPDDLEDEDDLDVEDDDEDEDEDDEDDIDADDEEDEDEDEEEDPDTLRVDADANSGQAIRSRLSEAEKSARGRNVPNTRHTA